MLNSAGQLSESTSVNSSLGKVIKFSHHERGEEVGVVERNDEMSFR